MSDSAGRRAELWVDATTSADVLAIGDRIARRLADEAREAGRVDEAIDVLTQGRSRRR